MIASHGTGAQPLIIRTFSIWVGALRHRLNGLKKLFSAGMLAIITVVLPGVQGAAVALPIGLYDYSFFVFFCCSPAPRVPLPFFFVRLRVVFFKIHQFMNFVYGFS